MFVWSGIQTSGELCEFGDELWNSMKDRNLLRVWLPASESLLSAVDQHVLPVFLHSSDTWSSSLMAERKLRKEDCFRMC
jgi:hypothetical protein